MKCYFVQKRLEELSEAKGILDAKVHSLEDLVKSLRADLRASKKKNRALEQGGASKASSLEKQIGDLVDQLEAEQKEKGQLIKVTLCRVLSAHFIHSVL